MFGLLQKVYYSHPLTKPAQAGFVYVAIGFNASSSVGAPPMAFQFMGILTYGNPNATG